MLPKKSLQSATCHAKSDHSYVRITCGHLAVGLKRKYIFLGLVTRSGSYVGGIERLCSP
jgi:hypothetical protein